MSGILRAIIVDDEEPARRILREYLTGMTGIQVAAECANGFEAVKAITELDPDLLFLDIQMPKLDGFEVLELLEREIPVIFVTAYDEFALRAFEVHALDYILKPFTQQRLAEAVARARERIARRPPAGRRALASEARRRRTPLERILVREGSRVHVIPVSSVDYFEAQDDYVCVAAGGKRLLKQQTLGDLETLLDPQRFVRVHRSFILNVERLGRLELYAKDSRLAILADGTHIPVSRTGYARLKKML
jgi:two-component system LytT family response regulator